MPASSLEELVSLGKRRGFIFPGSDLYGGLQGTYDYGPLGVELKNNLKASWWKSTVFERDDMEGLDSSILTHKLVMKYSGHEATFNDPLIDNRKSKKRYRLDHLLKDQKPPALAALRDKLGLKGDSDIGEMCRALLKNPEASEVALKDCKIIDPADGAPGDWTAPRPFNMMFKTTVGPVADENSYAYLRPETAQGIFVNFKNILDATSRKLPFGVAQIGKAFRNEITPRNFVFRVREFEQMEIEYFVKPGTDEKIHEEWLEHRLKWWEEQGVRRSQIKVHDVPKADLAHYSKRTYDLMYNFPTLGFDEIEGIANRSDYDLGSHTKGQSEFNLTAKVNPNTDSVSKLAVLDQETNKWMVPFVIEPSCGVDRAVLAVLSEAYTKEQVNDGERIVLKLKPHLSPIKIAVIPLAKNKEEITSVAKKIKSDLQKLGLGRVLYEDTGNVGKGYRRHDEIGTPFCVTVDYDTIGKGEDSSIFNTVTVRDRDTMKQERIHLNELKNYFRSRFENS